MGIIQNVFHSAGMNQMELSALIISPVPKLLSPTKAPATATTPASESEGSESGDSSAEEDDLYDLESEKRSGVQRIQPDKKSRKLSSAAHQSNDDNTPSKQGIMVNSDPVVSSGDADAGLLT